MKQFIEGQNVVALTAIYDDATGDCPRQDYAKAQESHRTLFDSKSKRKRVKAMTCKLDNIRRPFNVGQLVLSKRKLTDDSVTFSEKGDRLEIICIYHSMNIPPKNTNTYIKVKIAGTDKEPFLVSEDEICRIVEPD